ncbi:hypothetical protein HYS31_05310 [Candidatus Woesearchaeota archaeon]|nr:hypothetical protein [Candidatus Woesearchaeota archaeon]
MRNTKKLLSLLITSWIYIFLFPLSTLSQDCSRQGLEISTGDLPTAFIGKSYSAIVSAQGGKPSYQWEVSGLPPGLRPVSRGCSKGTNVYHPRVYIEGTPTAAGTYQVTITVDDGSDSDSGTYTLNVQQDTTPLLRVLYPNGRETLETGKTYELRWNFNYPNSEETSATSISLEQAQGTQYQEKVRISNNAETKVGNNRLLWTVPTGYEGNNYRVKVWLDKLFQLPSGASISPSDVSDLDFSIIPDDGFNEQPTITGLPDIPSNAKTGQSVSFSWSAVDSDNDDLYWKIDWGDGTKFEETCPSSQNSAKRGWSVTKSHSWQAAGPYNIRASITDCKGGTDAEELRITIGLSIPGLPPGPGDPGDIPPPDDDNSGALPGAPGLPGAPPENGNLE